MNQPEIRRLAIMALFTGMLFACEGEIDLSSASIEHLQCESLNAPLGIDARFPRLSWQIRNGDVRGQRQTAYRVLAASTLSRLHEDRADLWDTGKVVSDQSRQVEYAGQTLSSRARCFWKVRIWDKDGHPSEWSEPSSWSMGLLAKEDWTAQWIGSPDPVTAPFYRKSFMLEEVPAHAPVYIASLGYYELYINGQKVSRDVLAPAVSNFSKRSYYNTYDVAGLLRKGKNFIGIKMGTGWYSPGLPGVMHQSPVVRAQLDIPGKSGMRVITDTSWETKSSERSLLGKWRWGNFGGERVDARLIDRHWWNPERSTAGWKPAVPVQTAEVPCSAQPCLNNIRLDEISPASIERLDDATVVVDFGINLTGMLRMNFQNLDRDREISIHYADLDGRNPDEAWRLKMDRKGFSTYRQHDAFISAGEKNEQFENLFNYHGFRYALIEGLPYLPEKDDLRAVPVMAELAETGSFSCSNDLYNRIHQMVRWTYQSLALGGQTVDCPHRERVGYGDGQTIMDVGCYNFDASAFYAKWARDWWDEQSEDGFVPFVAPTHKLTAGGPAWGAMCITVPWKTYLFYNDRKLLEDGYPHMKKYIEYLGDHVSEGILQDMFPDDKRRNLGDWVPPGKGMDKQWVDDHSRRLFNNCYRIHLLQIMTNVGTVLERNDDVAEFRKEMETAQKAVHEHWFNPADKTYANCEQPYLVFPLSAGITPEELKDEVFRKYEHTLLVEDNGHLNTGMMGTQIMFDYLLEQNRNDLIDIMVNQRTYPGWGYMIEKGATTCWEQWNGYYSQIHSCFPYIGGWFYRGLGGIQWDPQNPGFKKVILRPAPVKSVGWVNCTYASPMGEIVSNWKMDKDRFLLEVKIPANASARIYLPTNDMEGITESGMPADECQWVDYIGMENRSAIYEVGSGSYRFSSPYKK